MSKLWRVLLRSAQSPSSFQAEHPGAGLPAITDLAAAEASGPIAAALSKGYARRVKEIHAVVALTPAAVAADVKASASRKSGPRTEVVPWYTDEQPNQQPRQIPGCPPMLPQPYQQELFHRVFSTFIF